MNEMQEWEIWQVKCDDRPAKDCFALVILADDNIACLRVVSKNKKSWKDYRMKDYTIPNLKLDGVKGKLTIITSPILWRKREDFEKKVYKLSPPDRCEVLWKLENEFAITKRNGRRKTFPIK